MTIRTHLAGEFARRVNPANKYRPAFTLMEMSVVTATLGLVLTLFVLFMNGLVKLELASDAALDRLLRQSALADQFRQDVSRAVAAPAQWQTWEAGPACLILQFPDSQHVVYHWEHGQILRLESASSGEISQTFSIGETTVRFSEINRLYTLRLEEKRSRGPERVLEISAALEGDGK